MLHLFQVTVGRQCENVACGMRGTRVGRDDELCEACHRLLTSTREFDRKKVSITIGAAILLVASLVYVTHLSLERRAAEREAQRMSQATARFQSALRGASASEVDAIARSVQADLQLTEKERQQILDASRSVIAGLPRALTADVQNRLEMRVRDVYGDGRISSDEQIALDQFAQEQRLAPQAVKAFQEKISDRLDDSYRSLAQGRSLAGAGKYEEARLAYSQATEIDPGNAMAWANLGAIYVLLGQGTEARSCYDKALSLDPENWLAHYNLGLLTARVGDRESAFQHLERALTSLPPTAKERGDVINGLLREPALEELRADPRFARFFGGGGPGARP